MWWFANEVTWGSLHIFTPNTPGKRRVSNSSYPGGVLVQISAVRRILYLNTRWNSLHWKENINHTYTRYTYYTGPQGIVPMRHMQFPVGIRWVPLAKHKWGPHGWFPDIPVCPDATCVSITQWCKNRMGPRWVKWGPDGWSGAHLPHMAPPCGLTRWGP
jgi:hypothetical protein